MIKDFTSYQQALKLKELGFDEPCFGRWWFNAGIHKLNEEELEIIKSYYFGLPEYYILAPTFSQAFRFFRDKGYDTKIEKESEGLYFAFYWTGVAWIIVGNGSYREAEMACLNKLITLIK